MSPYRDDMENALARIEGLERELAALRELARDSSRLRHTPRVLLLYGAAGVAVGAIVGAFALPLLLVVLLSIFGMS